MKKLVFLLLMSGSILYAQPGNSTTDVVTVAKEVLNRSIGKSDASMFVFHFTAGSSTDSYSIKTENNKVHITGTSATALCRGAYDYLRNDCKSIISWSGNKINIPEELPVADKTVKSPLKYRYYLNTVTHGYTTPYWGLEQVGERAGMD